MNMSLWTVDVEWRKSVCGTAFARKSPYILDRWGVECCCLNVFFAHILPTSIRVKRYLWGANGERQS